MRIVLHQPYFLPWLGFFSKMVHADGYVALDDVLFRKRHFHDRAQIVAMTGQVKWIGIPVGENLGTALNEIALPTTQFVPRITRTIEYSYARARHFADQWPELQKQIGVLNYTMTLAAANLCLIYYLRQLILPERTIPVWLASTMPFRAEDVTARIIDVCRHIGASAIILGTGASLSPFVHDLSRIRQSGIRIFIQDFHAAGISYFQVRRQQSTFVSGISAVDAILNIGPTATLALLSSASLEPVEMR